MTFRVQVPRDACLAERAFIAEVLLHDRLGLQIQVESVEATETVILGPDGRRLRMPDCFFPGAARDWLGASSMPTRPLQAWPMAPMELPGLPGGGSLPVIYGRDPAGGPLVERSDGSAYLALDVFGTAFFMLFRYEEVVEPYRDWAERFPGWASLAQVSGFLGRPVVDEYLTLLWRELQALWPGLARPRASYALELSHDLDWPYASVGVPVGVSLRKLAGDVLLRRSPALGLQRVRSMVAMAEDDYALDPNNTFEFIMDTSERLGHRSIFNVIAGHTAPGDMDGVYNLDDPGIRHLLRRFRDRGHEVGLHPSFETFRDGATLRAELANLQRAAAAEGLHQDRWGGRQHYLRWEASCTWRIYEAAGLAYDSSLGYADRPGFRCGTCHPFRTYDLQERRGLALVERPLVAMDGSLFWKDYLGVSLEEAQGILEPLVAQCRAYAGVFALLWHNTHLLTAREQRCYRELVAMAN